MNIQFKNIVRHVGVLGYGFTADVYLNNNCIGKYYDNNDGQDAKISFISEDAEKNFIREYVDFAENHPNPDLFAIATEKESYAIFRAREIATKYPYIANRITTSVVAGFFPQDFLKASLERVVAC